MWLQWVIFFVSVALQVYVIALLRRGAYKNYPFALVYSVVLLLTSVADALAPLFDHDSPERLAMLAGLADVRARLGEPGAAARVAVMASELAR